MHISLKNQDTGKIEAVMCVERASNTCIILSGDVERLDELVRLAQAQKVSRIEVIIPKEGVEELESLGWKVDRFKVVMHHE